MNRTVCMLCILIVALVLWHVTVRMRYSLIRITMACSVNLSRY